MNQEICIKFGKACVKKKDQKKFKISDVDETAVERCKFIEKIEMFGQTWLKFQDNRGWIWIQQEN